MAKAEGKTRSFLDDTHIDVDVLEPFPYKGARQYITYDTKEFSAVCPFSGLPDYGQLIVEYIPNDTCVELKSLKYYIMSYREVGIYQEDATNRLFKDLWELMTPEFLKITTVYNTRGGIDTTCEIQKGNSER